MTKQTLKLACDTNFGNPAYDDFLRVGGDVSLYTVEVKASPVSRQVDMNYVCLNAEDAVTLATDILNWAQGKGHDDNIHSMAKAIAADTKPEPQPTPAKGYIDLGDQAQLVLQHMRRAGSISAREAMDDYGITSAALARRICDIEETGTVIDRTRKVHPITQKRYTRYSLAA